MTPQRREEIYVQCLSVTVIILGVTVVGIILWNTLLKVP